MSKPLVALDYLARPAGHAPQPICVLFGDEPFLKRQVLTRLRAAVLAGKDAEFSSTSFAGPTATLSAVLDELSTLAMFGGGERLVVIDQADDFVSRYRAELERYAEHPKASSVLVLDVASWPSNTRLYKALADTGLIIECKFPAAARLQKWLIAWTKDQYHARLEADAAETLIEIIEPELGLFDSELSKLALLAGAEGVIRAELVREVVGGWRTRTTWDMLDLAAGGNARQALVELDHLLSAGEVPISILAQIGSTLRRFAAAGRLIEQAEAAGRRMSLRQALEHAGFKAFTLSKAESQLRQIGRVRAAQLYRWLLDADLALKGASSSPTRGRMVLERLLIRLSTAAAAEPTKRAAAG
ncbi:MAG TPA: DNA polymerase III subunit delta [Pirellulales bacterium]|jgi:DNA polymerase-3 subunit delta